MEGKTAGALEIFGDNVANVVVEEVAVVLVNLGISRTRNTIIVAALIPTITNLNVPFFQFLDQMTVL